MTTTQIGDLVTGKGVYAGIYEVNGIRKEAYFDPDFLRDASGKQLILNFIEAGEALARRNDGRRYGNGSEAAVRKAIAMGKYKDGDLVLAPREFLSGRDAEGYRVRPDNLVSLLRAGKESLKRIRDEIESHSEGHGKWVVSGTEHPGTSCCAYHVQLTNGFDFWPVRDGGAGVVPLRFFTPGP